MCRFFYYLLYLKLGFLSIAYLAVANLARLRISVYCQVSVRSQYLVRLLSQCWITGGHTCQPPIEGLLPPTCLETTPFRNLASKVAGLQLHTTFVKLIVMVYQYLCVINSRGMALQVPLYTSQKGFTQPQVSMEILTASIMVKRKFLRIPVTSLISN